ncbi:MAG: hypothetical protein ABI415_03250, partial [Flavitalea sp.]
SENMLMANAAAIIVDFDQSWDTRTSPNDLKYLEYSTDAAHTTWTTVRQYGPGQTTQNFPDTTSERIVAHRRRKWRRNGDTGHHAF